MKIAEVTCKECKAKYEILENFPKELLACPSCESKVVDYKLTEKEFEGCSEGCSSCDSCE